MTAFGIGDCIPNDLLGRKAEEGKWPRAEGAMNSCR
jgi:hypothetical protein